MNSHRTTLLGRGGWCQNIQHPVTRSSSSSSSSTCARHIWWHRENVPLVLSAFDALRRLVTLPLDTFSPMLQWISGRNHNRIGMLLNDELFCGTTTTTCTVGCGPCHPQKNRKAFWSTCSRALFWPMGINLVPTRFRVRSVPQSEMGKCDEVKGGSGVVLMHPSMMWAYIANHKVSQLIIVASEYCCYRNTFAEMSLLSAWRCVFESIEMINWMRPAGM